MNLLEIMIGLDIEDCLTLKNRTPITIELDILSAKKAALHLFFLIIMQILK